MNVLCWAMLSFWVGAIPFAVILGRIISGKDIRTIGDGNPGSANAWRAAGPSAGVAITGVEVLKGAAPVSLAILLDNVAGWGLAAIAVSPVVGHAFSPFLRFRGGKALAASAGIWLAVIPWGVGLLLGCLCFGLIHTLQQSRVWTAIIGFTLFGAIIILWLGQAHFSALWAANFAVFWIKYRKEFSTPMVPRFWLKQILGMRQ